MNDKKYNEIDFSAFQCEPIELTEAEKENIRHRFMDEKKNRKTKMRYVGTAAAAICLGLCVTVTALGGIEETFAAVKQLFMGPGEFLGVEEQDDYACVINETQTKGDYTITLNSVIAGDREMRFSVTTEVDGEKKAPYAWIGDVWIDGKKAGEDFYSDGIGHFGSPKEKELNKSLPKKRTCFPEITYDYKMPTNPKVKVVFSVGKEKFTYKFVLYNERFQKDTRTAEINKTMNLDGLEARIKKIVINPMEQLIYVDTDEILKDDKEHFESKVGFQYVLKGTNNLGENVVFYEWINVYTPNLPLRCTLTDVDDDFYESSSEGVTSYELQWYNWDTKEFVGEK
ncbi:MAG: DUF4179 domain-containing protein, partial [Firmicutes bacterium]|nr:DUF4179 domain-containing protein [Bacillota bacterium]